MIQKISIATIIQGNKAVIVSQIKKSQQLSETAFSAKKKQAKATSKQQTN